VPEAIFGYEAMSALIAVLDREMRWPATAPMW